MNEIENALFEEFKSLEKLCSDIFKENHGVTQYINAMEAAPFNQYRRIHGWQETLTQLKRVRHIRNNLAHGNNTYGTPTCTPDDIQWIQHFHDLIINRSDPLTMLHRIQNTQKKPIARAASDVLSNPQNDTNHSSDISDKTILLGIILTIVVVAICMAVAFFVAPLFM